MIVAFAFEATIRIKAFGMRQCEKFCTAFAKQIVLTMTNRLRVFVVDLPSPTCQGMCHGVS